MHCSKEGLFSTASEIEVFFALHIIAGTLKFPRIHCIGKQP
jgi:hypothetical protein